MYTFHKLSWSPLTYALQIHIVKNSLKHLRWREQHEQCITESNAYPDMQPSPLNANTIKIRALQTIVNIVVIIKSMFASHVCVYKWSCSELVLIIYIPVKSDSSILKIIVQFYERFCTSFYIMSLSLETTIIENRFYIYLKCKWKSIEIIV